MVLQWCSRGVLTRSSPGTLNAADIGVETGFKIKKMRFKPIWKPYFSVYLFGDPIVGINLVFSFGFSNEFKSEFENWICFRVPFSNDL